MFDCIIVEAGSSGGTKTYHKAKRDRKAITTISATKGTPSPW